MVTLDDNDQRIPPWHTKTSRRLASRPKIALLDTGLAARLAVIPRRQKKDPVRARVLVVVPVERSHQIGGEQSRRGRDDVGVPNSLLGASRHC
jgi:hypothetical protein